MFMCHQQDVTELVGWRCWPSSPAEACQLASSGKSGNTQFLLFNSIVLYTQNIANPTFTFKNRAGLPCVRLRTLCSSTHAMQVYLGRFNFALLVQDAAVAGAGRRSGPRNCLGRIWWCAASLPSSALTSCRVPRLTLGQVAHRFEPRA
jgi:hypothetical protein